MYKKERSVVNKGELSSQAYETSWYQYQFYDRYLRSKLNREV